MSKSTVYVYTMNRVGQVGAWSLYEFPFEVHGFAHLNGDLYIRSEDSVLRVDPMILSDFAGSESETFFDATIEWPWLDFGQPGQMKMLAGFDVVGRGEPTIEMGYNQAEPAFTEPFTVPEDTVPGMMIPLPVMAPSMSVRLTYAGGQRWELQAVQLYLQDQRITA